jgi:hypothetical protein
LLPFPIPEVPVACCIALATLIAIVRGAWTTLLPRRRRLPADFAPTARRPVPDSLAVRR